MLGQTAEAKMEKFVDTMPAMVQTHLITCENWAKTTKKAKELEHIIRKCDPLAAALPTLTQDAAVPGLYSHITRFDDKEETDIPQPFKGVKPKQTKNRAKKIELKIKQQQKPNPPPVQIQEEQYSYEDTNNYYHNENYRGQSEAVDPIEAKLLDDFSEVKILVVEANATKVHIKVNTKVTIIKAITTKVLMVNTTTHIEAILRLIIMANLEAEAMVMVELITMDVVIAGLIIEVI